MEPIEVEIERLSFRGDGLCPSPFEPGRWMRVPRALPKERVKASPHPYRPGTLACLEEVLRPSPSRRDPECPDFYRCSGCQLRSLPLNAQRTHRLEGWHRVLAEAGVARDFDEVISGVAEATRGRTRLSFDRSGKAGLRELFRPARVPMDHCPVLTEGLRDAVRRILPRISLLGFERLGLNTRHAGVELEEGMSNTRVTLESQAPREEALALAKALDPNDTLVLKRPAERGHVEVEVLSGDGRLEVEMDGRPFVAHPGAWVSAYPRNAAKVRSVLLSMAGHTPEQIIEVGCGVGIHSLDLMARANAFVGIDLSRPAIASAKENAQRVGLEPQCFRVGRADQSLRRLAKKGQRAQLAILHTMRRPYGKEVLRWLTTLGVQRVIHVAPSAYALARDLQALLGHGFMPIQLVGVETMPHTYHMMSVALLEREA